MDPAPDVQRGMAFRDGVGSGDFDISVDTVQEMVSVEFRNVVTVNSDYVIIGASLDIN